jgi:glycosyltransferase involved in cell wall biosynthesis
LVAAVGLAQRRGLHGTVSLAGGETQPGQLSNLQAQIARCACDSRVQMLGVVRGPEKERVLLESDCFILPSHGEGLPMAMLEAMAYGMPVIVTRVGAIPEAVTDGVEGFLIEPGDVEALADRMLRLARDPVLRQRMGEAARARVAAAYSLDAMVERIMALYREVLGRSGVRAAEGVFAHGGVLHGCAARLQEGCPARNDAR